MTTGAMTSEELTAWRAERASKVQVANERSEATICPQGGAHPWTFRRPQGYTCTKCQLTLTKDELKRRTD
jgi:hypothetical protein